MRYQAKGRQSKSILYDYNKIFRNEADDSMGRGPQYFPDAYFFYTLLNSKCHEPRRPMHAMKIAKKKNTKLIEPVFCSAWYKSWNRSSRKDASNGVPGDAFCHKASIFATTFDTSAVFNRILIYCWHPPIKNHQWFDTMMQGLKIKILNHTYNMKLLDFALFLS